MWKLRGGSMIPGIPNLLLLMLIDSCLMMGSMMCKRSSDGGGRKKVVIIGEMSDLAFEMATNASASTNYAVDDVTFADYDDPLHEDLQSPPADNLQPHRFSPSTHSKFHLQGSRTRPRIRPWNGKRTAANSGISQSPGSVFVPVAAYSVTHSRVGPGPNGVRRMRPGKTTESAVYGYVQKPEIVEFRGQYFYGPNPSPSSHHSMYHYPSSSHHHYSPSMAASASDTVSSSSSWLPFGSGNKISNKSGGLGPGGLLLATLPLILAPMLSYLFTPMVIPVTATIAAGKRRRKRNIESHVPLDPHPDFNQTFLTVFSSSPSFSRRRFRVAPAFLKHRILESMSSDSSLGSDAAPSVNESDPREGVTTAADIRAGGLRKNFIPLTYPPISVTRVHGRQSHSQSEANKGPTELQSSRKTGLRILSLLGRGS